MMAHPPKLYIYSDVPRIKTITPHNFYSFDLRPLSKDRDVLYTFTSKEVALAIMPKDCPYFIQEMDAAHVVQYCTYNKTHLHVVKRCFCDLLQKNTSCEIEEWYNPRL